MVEALRLIGSQQRAVLGSEHGVVAVSEIATPAARRYPHVPKYKYIGISDIPGYIAESVVYFSKYALGRLIFSYPVLVRPIENVLDLWEERQFKKDS